MSKLTSFTEMLPYSRVQKMMFKQIEPDASCPSALFFSFRNRMFYSSRAATSAATEHPYSSLLWCVHPHSFLIVLLTQVDSPWRGPSYLDATPPQTLHALALSRAHWQEIARTANWLSKETHTHTSVVCFVLGILKGDINSITFQLEIFKYDQTIILTKKIQK